MFLGQRWQSSGLGTDQKANAHVLHRWYRHRALKKMTVEMAQTGEGQGPFVWPDNPEDLSPYVTISPSSFALSWAPYPILP